MLRALKDASGPSTVHAVAEQLGVHPNTVRFHVNALVRSGQVERVPSDRRASGRPPLLFRPTPGMDPTGPRHYQLLAEFLVQSVASSPDRIATVVETAHAWGRRQASSDGVDAGDDDPADAVARLMGLLREIGFAPEWRGDGARRQIGLRHCPFLELARERSDIVCPVHLGLMQGVMDAWRSPVTVGSLEPFIEPDLCLANLVPAGALEETV